MAQKLQQQLRDVGSKLENPPASKDALVKLLKHAENYLSELDQSPMPSMLESMQPCLNAIVKPEFLRHQDRDVKVMVAACICEITRITAPEAPYSDDVLRDIFHLIVGTLSGLSDINSPSFGRRVLILETLAKYRSCVVMLDLECNDLTNEMFSTFFSVVSDDHPESVLKLMQTIMILILDESEDVQENLLFTILSILGQKRSDVSMAARRLAMNVIEHCAGKLEPYVKQFLVSSMSGDSSSLNSPIDYHEVIYVIYQCAPQILCGIIPYITGELLTDQLDVRLKAVKLLGELFSLPGLSISESFQPLFSEFLKRLADRVVEVRLSVIEHVKNCLISNPSRAEAPEILSALCDRLLDYDENVRKQVVAAVYDVACHELKSIPSETARLVSERLRDKSLSVKRYTMERLAELYRLYCLKSSDGSIKADEFGWIPGKILRCLYDKDFRSEMIEVILCGSLFPPEFSIRDKVKHWVMVFLGFDKVEVKALEQLLMQKQRLQQEMHKYLSLRQTHEDGDAPEFQKRISSCFWTMSRLFNDHAKAEDCFLILNQLKDANIWKILTCLLDPCSSFRQAWTCRDDLLKILGEKHPLYDFMGTLSMKCSYLLFNKEYVKEILSETAAQQSGGNTKLILSCMNLLAILASFSPSLLTGSEEDLVHLLKEDNEVIKEGIAHVLAKAGGTLREQLAKASSSVDLLLERLCLEGSRKQAKYSVQALAAITKDDGLKSLSVLYKRLVDMLEEKTHLPAILQSLGCIAQTAMPVFETREGEIVDFITKKILECSNTTDGNSENKTDWNERSELCLLKIFGIKTLVKSFLPIKDAHLRLGIEKLLDILKNILSFGEISKDIGSSTVDRSHMKLAAAKAILRLSKHWDHKITVDIFYLALNISQDIYPECRKLFLSKVHQYIKERLLDAKYACAFLFNITETHSLEFKEDKHNLVEVVQMCHQLKARQISLQCDVNSLVAYPEYILPYLVHALAHHSSCPNIIECSDVQAFEPIYWRLHLFLSALLLGDEGLQPDINSNRTKESFTTVVSILHSIKCSEDVVDKPKSKNSHAICDLGLSIAKHLVRDQADFSGLNTSVALPAVLYNPLEKSQGDDSMANDDQMWLGGDTIVAHFELLKSENKEKIGSGAGENETVSKDSDKDGTEVSLGKMMKNLKSQVARRKKIVKKKMSISETKNSEHELDILGMVRDINLDNRERTQIMELSKLEQDHRYALSGQTAIQDNAKKVLASQKNHKNKNTSPISVPAPKRKRSPFIHRSHLRGAKSWTKGSEGPLQSYEKAMKGDHAEVEFPTEKDKANSTDSDLLVSCLPSMKTFSSGTKRKGTSQNSNGRSHTENSTNNEVKKSTMPVEAVKKTGIPRSSSGSIKKRKRSISGLTKCTTEKTVKNGAELVGCRIKVWWPMDKQFYEGMVQSYDPGKKKHVILYDDGDMEDLQLDKEKWELSSNGYIPMKRLKSQHLSSSKKISAEKKSNRNSVDTEGASRRKKNSPKKVRRKITPKGDLERDWSRVSEMQINTDSSDVESRDSSDLPDVHPPADSEVDDVNLDGSSRIHAPPMEAGEKTEQDQEVLEESTEAGKPDSPSSSGNEDSDDEPLSAWKQRAGK